MERMTLIVKGNALDATHAAHAHGFAVQATSQGRAETTVRALGTSELAAAWLGEPGEVPYPAGALLYYR